MAEFKFRLATLLRMREATRDQRRAELAESQRAEAATRCQFSQWQVEWSHLKSTARQATSPGVVEVERLVDAYRYQQTLEARRRQLEEQLAQLTGEIAQRREALLQADRDVRTLEKLRDAQVLRHHQEAHRQEIKRLDEATQLRVAVGGLSST
jgi:flagellar protein FliJ